MLSALYWFRVGKRDARLPWIFLGGLVGAFVGAKVVYLAAEGWVDFSLPGSWLRLATGKTILGGLLFGYLGVELAKRALDYGAPTGDRFAVVVPLGIFLGRLGCLSHGCCLGRPCDGSAWYAWRDAAGVARWPVVPAELVFHGASAGLALALARAGMLRGQRFHAYLIAYGVFRFLVEFERDTVRWWGWLSGYHVAALALVVLGGIRAVQRWRTGTAGSRVVETTT